MAYKKTESPNINNFDECHTICDICTANGYFTPTEFIPLA